MLAIAVVRYTQGDRAESLQLGIEALEVDSRYADLEFLEENLWGRELLAATQIFFEAPSIKAILAQL